MSGWVSGFWADGIPVGVWNGNNGYSYQIDVDAWMTECWMSAVAPNDAVFAFLRCNLINQMHRDIGIDLFGCNFESRQSMVRFIPCLLLLYNVELYQITRYQPVLYV